MKVLPFYKDLILQYACDCEENKGNAETLKMLKAQLVEKINLLRDRFPELLFVNYESMIDEESANNVFENIKERVKERYSISLLPDTLRLDDNIVGEQIETPGFIEMERGGYLLFAMTLKS